MEHFYNPTTHTAKSLMPVFPFDETKLYLLTYTLDRLAQHNTQALQEIWNHRGFNPELAYRATMRTVSWKLPSRRRPRRHMDLPHPQKSTRRNLLA